MILVMGMGCSRQETFSRLMRAKHCDFDPIRDGCWCVFYLQGKIHGISWAPFFECNGPYTKTQMQNPSVVGHDDPTRDHP